MKTSLILWAIALALALFTLISKAAGADRKALHLNTPTNVPPAQPAPAERSWWTKVSISPYGAVKHPDFGKPVWGAGLDLGYSINRTVSLHLGNSIFDQPDIERKHETLNQDWFSGSAIDETELLFRADLIRGGGTGKDRFVGYLIGSGTRDWESEDWGFGVGAGAELRFTKNVSLGADSRIRAWFDAEKDVITRGFLSLRF